VVGVGVGSGVGDGVGSGAGGPTTQEVLVIVNVPEPQQESSERTRNPKAPPAVTYTSIVPLADRVLFARSVQRSESKTCGRSKYALSVVIKDHEKDTVSPRDEFVVIPVTVFAHGCPGSTLLLPSMTIVPSVRVMTPFASTC
jgi:hypothetical protein